MVRSSNNYKIVFSGPVGAGKTTAIATLSDVPPIRTDQLATDETATRKPQTTVAMDYGLMKINAKERIHLYGTPGQERFNFMWDILAEGGIGLVLLLDNTRANTFDDMNFFLDAFKNFIWPNKIAIGVTRSDLTPTPTIAEYHAHLNHPFKPAIFQVDARERTDMVMLIEALLYTNDPGIVSG